MADRHRRVVVSDRRCFLLRSGRTDDDRSWHLDGLLFDEVTEWREGRTHDGRPIVRLEHPPHERPMHVPRYRFLWFGG